LYIKTYFHEGVSSSALSPMQANAELDSDDFKRREAAVTRGVYHKGRDGDRLSRE
jgi:hypothetical protein